MNDQDKKKLLALARKSLENELNGSRNDLDIYDTAPFRESNGLFVTLLKNGNLRGCIGRIESDQSLYENVVDLSKAAAFNDHRFDRLTPQELDNIVIEISILSIPQDVEGDSSFDKVSKIVPDRDGVVLSAKGKRATFLPQVWESIPVRENFVSELCRKAGLSKNYWEKNPVNLSTYQVEFFKED